MQPKRIPTILGLVLVVGAIFLFSFVFDRVSPLLSRAEVSIDPQDVVISNITDTTFTVSWVTPEQTTGTVAVANALDERFTAFDDRDTQTTDAKEPTLGKYTTHVVSVRTAKPNTKYNLTIVSNGKFIANDKTTFDVTTGPTLEGNGVPREPAYGSVTTADGKPAEGALAYLTLEGGSTLSTTVQSSGSWVIPLNLARTQDLQSYLPENERIGEELIIRTAQGDAYAQTDTINDNPVPAMVIGKKYDFRKIQADAHTHDEPVALTTLEPTLAPTTKPIAQATTRPTVLGQSTLNKTYTIAITQPKDQGALSSNLPQFTGTGFPGQSVSYIVGITSPQSGTTVVGTDGIWRFTPQRPLAAGRQSVTITTKDNQNKPKAITRMFEILKSGTQVLGSATPSGTLTPTIALEISPTIDLTPTETATLTAEPIPDTGSPLPLIVMLVGGFMFLSTGILIFAKKN